MIGGSLLFVFCLFMISVSQPEHFYQVCLFHIVKSNPHRSSLQVYLPHGLGLGIAIGIMYIPAVGVVSHYFQRRRALAIGLATSVRNSSTAVHANIHEGRKGSAVGGAIHPIILNTWFHGSLGFHRGVRASAGLTGGLLAIAILLMKPRYPEKKKSQKVMSSLSIFLRDVPYVIMVFGWVIFASKLILLFSSSLQDRSRSCGHLLSCILYPTQRNQKWC
jgi:hypothetical protein